MAARMNSVCEQTKRKVCKINEKAIYTAVGTATESPLKAWKDLVW
jgi:hypothetical protein